MRFSKVKKPSYLHFPRRLKRRFLTAATTVQFGVSITATVILSFIVAMFFPVSGFFLDGPSKWIYLFSASPNEIGDTLAGFAGTLAFIWIIVTVVLQSNELAEQRKEIKLSRQAYEKTNDHLDQQRFENLFFELVSTHNSIVNSMEIRAKEHITHAGRRCFSHFEAELRPFGYGSRKSARLNYPEVFSKNTSLLGHYLRFLHNSLRAIDESAHSTLVHRRLFRALFSDDELIIIFYNSLSEPGKKLVPYLAKFAFFYNLPIKRLDEQGDMNELPSECFGDPL